ncbi:hypothetical protein HZS_1806 [Henneguya salminicola]|nr:hypothetical protein HZS_1806 [Henneguya salminicola]
MKINKIIYKTPIQILRISIYRQNIDGLYNYNQSSINIRLNVRIIIISFETHREEFITNETILFNKHIKNKGKYIHNFPFFFLLGYMDSTSILNNIGTNLKFTYLYRNYEDILLYIIKNKWNKYISKELTIIKNIVSDEYYYEISLIANKLEEIQNVKYSRINGYWCKNTVKILPQVIDEGN